MSSQCTVKSTSSIRFNVKNCGKSGLTEKRSGKNCVEKYDNPV